MKIETLKIGDKVRWLNRWLNGCGEEELATVTYLNRGLKSGKGLIKSIFIESIITEGIRDGYRILWNQEGLDRTDMKKHLSETKDKPK